MDQLLVIKFVWSQIRFATVNNLPLPCIYFLPLQIKDHSDLFDMKKEAVESK